MDELCLESDALVDLVREAIGRGGRLRLRVRGHSMRPTIADGDRVVLGPMASGGPRPGEIVLVSGVHGVRLHRLVALEREAAGVTLWLSGDAAPAQRERFALHEACARVERVQRTLGNRLSARLTWARLRRWLGIGA